MDHARAELVLSFLGREGLLDRRDVLVPAMASIQDIRRVHDDTYLESLHDRATLEAIIGVPIPGDRIDEVLDTYRLMSGGTIAAVRIAVSSAQIGVNLGGGFHHARPDRGHGFCVYNDIAIAIARLRHDRFDGRIMVVDLDLHDGDGTRIAFAQDASVHTFSIHNQTWSDAPAVESTTIALGAGFGDAAYLAALEEHLPPVLSRFDPELVIYVAGVDVAREDRMGDAKMTAEGVLARDSRVLALVRGSWKKRGLAIVMAGGYGSDAWRHTARFMATILYRSPIEPPDTETMRLARLRYLARLLEPERLGDIDSSLDINDLGGALGFEPPPSRLLGFYTRHGVELALERFGFIDRLRALGYSQPHVDIEVGGTTGDLLRVFGDPSRKELLVELRLRRDAHLIAGAQVLFLEWILLQNPRAAFTAERPALPGQARPGLGLLSGVMHLMVLVCDRLGLAGVASVPGYYHLARQAKPNMRFVAAEAEAHYRALDRAVSGLPLRVASWAIDRGELIDAKTGQPVAWKPSPMVMPVTDAARATPEWEAEVARIEATLEYTIQVS